MPRLADVMRSVEFVPCGSDLRPLADCPDVGLNGFQILEGVRPFGHVPQQGGGMVDGSEPDLPTLKPGAVFTGNAEIRANKPLGSDPAEANNNLWLYQ